MSNLANTECVVLPSANISYANVTGIVILTFCTFGVAVTLLCLAALCNFWNSPIVKASNRVLGFSLLLTILASFPLVYIDVFKTTDVICMIIYPLRYLNYKFCLSVLLVKVLLISSAFQVPIMTSLEFTSLLNKAQVGIVIDGCFWIHPLTCNVSIQNVTPLTNARQTPARLENLSSWQHAFIFSCKCLCPRSVPLRLGTFLKISARPNESPFPCTYFFSHCFVITR